VNEERVPPLADKSLTTKKLTDAPTIKETVVHIKEDADLNGSLLTKC
jgi:hypothetical protein